MKEGYFDDLFDVGGDHFTARYHVRVNSGRRYVSEVEVLEIPENFSYPEGWNIEVGMRFDPQDKKIIIPNRIVWE